MSSIGFKNLKVLNNMFVHAWYPQLRGLLQWLKVRYSKDQIIITSAYRNGDPGVHGTKPLRAIDIRSRLFDDPVKITEDINNYWVYDPKRPDIKVAKYHDVGTGLHIHLQVHPRTFLKKE